MMLRRRAYEMQLMLPPKYDAEGDNASCEALSLQNASAIICQMWHSQYNIGAGHDTRRESTADAFCSHLAYGMMRDFQMSARLAIFVMKEDKSRRYSSRGLSVNSRLAIMIVNEGRCRYRRTAGLRYRHDASQKHSRLGYR